MYLASFLPALLITLIESCEHESLCLYRTTLDTLWTPEKFPKHYPEWRPHAQWSKTVGRSHDASFSLYRIGSVASAELKNFLTGNGDAAELDSKSEVDVLDQFNLPAISQGNGTAIAEFFVDGAHTKVSLATKMIPSPDWFIGVDSVDLCDRRVQRWKDKLAIHVFPLDGGCESGFTFTSPVWPTDPQEPVSHIVSNGQYLHPANSFAYPHDIESIGVFTFHKIKEYVLRESSANEIISHQRRKPVRWSRFAKRRLYTRRQRDCIVSEWSPWSPCSQMGHWCESHRRRRMISSATKHGRQCPPLNEERSCDCHGGDTEYMIGRHFNWESEKYESD